MRILAACSLGGAGHLNPLLPFLAAARRRGDDTLVLGPPALEEMVARAGYPFRAGGEPDEAEVAAIRERLPIAPRREATVLGNRDLFGRLAARAMLPGAEQTFRDWRPDLVLRDPCEYASAAVALLRAIPSAQVAISLAEAEAASITAAAPALEELRTGLAGRLLASTYLTRFPASLDPSPFPATVRFRDGGAARPGPDWWAGSEGPLVYMTFGSVLGYMSIASDIYRAALNAVDGLRARVLLTTGHKFDRSDLGPVPPNVRVEAWVEQADVLPHADVVVCHGGSGTVFGAVAAGVPLVVVPVFADQFENGRRVEAQGAGVVVTAAEPRVIGMEDAPRIAEAVRTVLATPSYRQRAQRLAEEMAATRTVDEVLDTLVAGVA